MKTTCYESDEGLNEILIECDVECSDDFRPHYIKISIFTERDQSIIVLGAMATQVCHHLKRYVPDFVSSDRLSRMAIDIGERVGNWTGHPERITASEAVVMVAD